jgi:hypothetical protein
MHRDPLSPRYSEDIDIFHDPRVEVKTFAHQDAATLRQAGLEVSWEIEGNTFYRAWVEDRSSGERIKLEWARDTAFRFFPVEPDPVLGYRLHWADLATNKILAGAGRMVIRDFVDLVFLHEGWLPLGALAWAAPAKDPGLSPLFILNELVRTSRYRPEHLARVRLREPVTVVELKQRFLAAVREAERLINALPAEELGCLYLDASGRPVAPDPASPDFPKLTRHHACLRGAWPRVVTDEPTDW